jgi:diguanylate cyclase (GGDEF)-like protein
MNTPGLVGVQLMLYSLLWVAAVRLLREDRPALWHWFGYTLVTAVALWLVAWRGTGPIWWTSVAADIGFVLGVVLARRGVEIFLRLTPSDRSQGALMAVAVMAFVWTGPEPDQQWLRVVWVALFLSVTILGSLKRCWAVLRVQFGPRLAFLTSMPGVAMALLNMAHAAETLLQRHRPVVIMAEDHQATWVATLVSAGLFNFFFLFMVAYRLLNLLDQQARHDALTGLLNRHAMSSLLQQAWSTYQRHGTPFWLVCLDVDHFKQVNDQHGHPAGDAVLVSVAQRMQSQVRQADLLARMGGEEFLMLLPACGSAEAAWQAAERLRTNLAQAPLTVRAGVVLQITLSAGVAGVSPGLPSLDELLRQADAALYAAKHAGRNRIRLAPDWPGERRSDRVEQPAS